MNLKGAVAMVVGSVIIAAIVLIGGFNTVFSAMGYSLSIGDILPHILLAIVLLIVATVFGKGSGSGF